ncbi:MAG: cytidylate kinase-like family protein [Solobacterium sp.]|nr:cytidylate kinase-like family protein [Solobacterium sp.]
MAYRIITISRQFGSAGRTIGRMLAAELGIKCYDREIIEEVAQRSGLAKEYIESRGEYSVQGTFGAVLNRGYYGGLTNEDRIWQIQCDIIRELAEEESCVIVGRCSDYLLKDRPDVLRVFVHAPIEWRAKRIVNVYGETEEEPEKRLKEKDKHRAAYYNIYTDMKFGDARNYDLCLNSASLGIDSCVSIIRQLVKQSGETEEQG